MPCSADCDQGRKPCKRLDCLQRASDDLAVFEGICAAAVYALALWFVIALVIAILIG